MIKRAKKCKTVNFKNHIRTIRFSFMIYANFKSILLTENNGEQNPDESYIINQNDVGCSFGHKLVCIDDQLSKCYLDQDVVHKFVTNMVEKLIAITNMV